MKIVCLVKQVPRADSIEFDQGTKQLKREGVPLLLNPFDAAAVMHAAKLSTSDSGEPCTYSTPSSTHCGCSE